MFFNKRLIRRDKRGMVFERLLCAFCSSFLLMIPLQGIRQRMQVIGIL